MNTDSKVLIEAFQDTLWAEDGLSENTLKSYASDLKLFSSWLQRKNLLETGSEDVSAYLALKFQQGTSARSSARLLSSLKRFFSYLVRQGKLAENPIATIAAPRIGKLLPITLTELEVEKVLDAPDVSDAQGFRDRTMLELLYATGLSPIPKSGVGIFGACISAGYSLQTSSMG